MLGKAIKLNLEDLIPFVAVEGGVFLLYELIEAIIMYTAKPSTSGAVCGLILMAFGVMMNLFAGAVYPSMNVEMLLRYGVIRKTALLATLGSMTLNMAASMALAAFLGWVDGRIAQAWVNALPWVHEVESIGPPWWFYFVIGLGAVCLALGAGALLQKFGRRAFWVGWGAWMLLVVGINVVDMDALIESPAALPTVIGLCVVSLVTGCALTMRCTVKN